MAAKITLPIFEKFSIDETTTIASRWAKYKLRFGNLCKAIGVTDDGQKLAMLLHYIGEEVFDIYTNIFVPGTDETFANAVDVLDNHFKPKAHISYEICKFRNLKQQTDETTQQFYIRVKEHAMKCEFDANLKKKLNNKLNFQRTTTNFEDIRLETQA